MMPSPLLNWPYPVLYLEKRDFEKAKPLLVELKNARSFQFETASQLLEKFNEE